jgi:hypothetical protein
MGSILPFLGNYAFDANVTRSMGEAYEAACKKLRDNGQPAVVREVIAKRIIAAALLGERDIVRLREAGIAGLNRLSH